MSLNIETVTDQEAAKLTDPTRLYWDDVVLRWMSQDGNIKVTPWAIEGQVRYDASWRMGTGFNTGDYVSSPDWFTSVGEAQEYAAERWNQEWA